MGMGIGWDALKVKTKTKINLLSPKATNFALLQ